MSVPSSYNAADLAAYMDSELGVISDALAFTVPASYSQAVVKTLIAYGVTDIGSATDVPRLLALATVEAWRLAVGQLTPQINISTDGRGQDKAGIFDHALEMLRDAEINATRYPGDGTGVNRSGAGRVVVRYRDGLN